MQICDFRVFPELDANYENGSIRVATDIRNLADKTVKDYSISYSLYSNKLYSDENILVEGVAGTVLVSEVKREGNLSVTTTIHIDTPKQW